MKLSYQWLSELVDLKGASPEQVSDMLTSRGLEVEEIHRQGKGFEKVISAQILERGKHPDSDRLSLCKVSTGTETLEIVCGAQNMKAQDKVALALVGAELPNGMKIAQSKIRGVASFGMLCSLDELGLTPEGQESEGILILPQEAKIGQPLADVLGLKDTVLTLKLTANRGDCLSHFGIARELSAALGTKAKEPHSQKIDFKKGMATKLDLQAGESGSQFFAVAIEGVRVGPSPSWVVQRLESIGSRSINNVVDATNLAMLELGHPMHAYDADRLKSGTLAIRLGKRGERLNLLDAGAVELDGSELVISDGTTPVGLAGVMGGLESSVQLSTTRLLLECAEFQPSLIRKSAQRHQRRTDAAQRFEKGIDPEGLERAISRLAALIVEWAGGKIMGAACAQTPSRDKSQPTTVMLSPTWVREFLGISESKCSDSKMREILTALDCKVSGAQELWRVEAPSYRRDLRIPEDFAEEVARSVGYDAIETTVPVLTSAPVARSASRSSLALLDLAKNALVEAGLSEALCYSFSSKKELARFGFESPRVIINPLSEELEAMVPSLLPGLVTAAQSNFHSTFGSEVPSVRLFEVRPSFPESDESIAAKGEMETGVAEAWRLSFLISGTKYQSALKVDQAPVDLFDVKDILDRVLDRLGARGVRLQALPQSRNTTPAFQRLSALFHPGQSVEVLAGKDSAGVMGLLHPRLALNMKLKTPIWLGELDWELLSRFALDPAQAKAYKPWPAFPTMERDFALIAPSDVSAEKLTSVALKAGKPLVRSARVFDVYQGAQVAHGQMSVALRVILAHDERALTEAEADQTSQQLISAWKKELGIELRS